MDVRIFKLLNGEEIICELEGESNKEYKVSAPFGITVNPESKGLVLFPWSVATYSPEKKSININKNAVIFVSTVPEAIEKSYIENTTNIIVPTQQEKNLILG